MLNMQHFKDIISSKFFKLGLLFGCLIFASIFSLTFISSSKKNLSIVSPASVNYISSGIYNGNYLVMEDSGLINVFDQNGLVIWNSSAINYTIKDAEILPNGNLMVIDSSNDQISEISFANPTENVWNFCLNNVTHINWTAIYEIKNWSIPARNFIDGYYNGSNGDSGIADFDFIEGSQFHRNYDAILLTLQNFDIVLEIKYTEGRELVSIFGQPLNYNLLNHPVNVIRLTSGNTIISDQGNHRIVEMAKNYFYFVWKFNMYFPGGDLTYVQDCLEYNSSHIIINDAGNSRLLLVNLTGKALDTEYIIPEVFYITDIELINETLLICDNLGSQILFYNLSSGSSDLLFGKSWKYTPCYAIIGSFMSYNLILMITAFLTYERKISFKIFTQIDIISPILALALGSALLLIFKHGMVFIITHL